MTSPAISIQNLSKSYRLGVIGRQTLVDEMRYWIYKLRGIDPRAQMKKIGHTATEARRVEAEKKEQNLFWALQDVSFDVQPGEVVGIIGKNGAGKSTLLKVLSKITEPTAGDAFLQGRVGALLEVGTGFHPELTGRENIFMNGTILGMRRQEIAEKFDDIVAFSELEEFIDTPVKRYSSGMYVRLAFAVAAHLEPEILVIDEVLAVGDATFQKRCLNKMSEVGSQGRTVLFVSHNMPAVLRLCTRCIWLDKGKVAAIGSPQDVVQRYMEGLVEIGSEKKWTDRKTAPGNEIIKLISVSLLNEQDQLVSLVNVEESLRLRIEYHVEQAGEKFRCIAAFNTQGVCAFAGVEPTEQSREKRGTYSSVLNIPGNLLAEGEYIVNISIIASRGVKLRHVAVRNVLSFQVSDPIEGTSARGDYTEGYGGILRPLLKWNMNYEGA